MSSASSITVESLAWVVGTLHAPRIIDVRTDRDVAADPILIPGSVRRIPDSVMNLSQGLGAAPVVCVCLRGHGQSQGAAAWLRHEGIETTYLAGGLEAWRDAGQPTTRAEAVPPRDGNDRTVWVTRERPKIDRIACPWLIRRFVDPDAVFLFVAAPEVPSVAERFAATPFDIEGVFWSHRGETCTFDTMLSEFGLKSPALDLLATIVRGADTARPDLVLQAPGLLAISLGLSQLIDDDLEQLEAGMLIYDALYLWCRDAFAETHNWPSTRMGEAP